MNLSDKSHTNVVRLRPYKLLWRQEPTLKTIQDLACAAHSAHISLGDQREHKGQQETADFLLPHPNGAAPVMSQDRILESFPFCDSPSNS